MGVRRAFRGGRLLGQPQAWQAALLGTCETVRPDAAPAGAPRSPAGPGGQPWSRSGQSSRWPAGTAVPDPRGPLLSLPLPPLSRRPCPAPELTQVHSELRSPPLTAGGDRAALPGAPRAAAAACALPRPPSLSSLRSPVGVGWDPFPSSLRGILVLPVSGAAQGAGGGGVLPPPQRDYLGPQWGRL